MNIKPIQGMFSQGDGTIDEAIACVFLGTLAMIAYEGVDIQTADFDPMKFGAGMAAMWTGAGALMKLRPGNTGGNIS